MIQEARNSHNSGYINCWVNHKSLGKHLNEFLRVNNLLGASSR